MKEFERSEEYQTKIFLESFDNHVVLDAKIEITYQGNKLKAYCPATKTYLQFPRALRTFCGKKYIADVIKSRNNSGTVFYRAYRKSVRNPETGEVVG